MLSVERRKQIVEILERDGRVDVNELAQRLGASKETIRRDLRECEQQGLLRRTHGGAVNVPRSAAAPAAEGWDPAFGETPVAMRRTQETAAKQLLCQKAASFIRNKDVIYVDNSSTTLFLAQYIPRDIQVTVITNSIYFILETVKLSNPNILLFCVAGFLNVNNLSLYGSSTVKTAGDLFPSKAFLSCAGITSEGQITDTSFYETDTKRALIQRSSQVFLLADHTKFGQPAPYFLAGLGDIDYVITDKRSDPEALRYLESSGVSLVLANDERGG